MIIAVNSRFLREAQPDDLENFITECFSRLAVTYPQHQFIYIFNKPFDKGLNFPKNVTAVIAGPEIKNTILLQYWLNYKLPALLRKYKAEVFIGMDGMCSLHTKLPQCMLVHDLSFMQYPDLLKKKHVRFLKKFTPRFLAKAKNIVTVSQFHRSLIINKFKANTNKIDTIPPGINEIFGPVSFEERELIKEKYAEGREYFFCRGSTGPNSNLINLLKAFSFFKKRQKSNMMLLIAGKTNEQFKQELKTFKFRNEVNLLEDLSNEETAKLTAAAYAMVHPVFYDAFATATLGAMQCKVPVLCSNTDTLTEFFDDAALYFNPEDFKDIAEKMMLVFKDEDMAKKLVKAGEIQCRRYHWDKTAGLLWQSILKAIDS